MGKWGMPANVRACWRQGGVLITGCMHFVKCRTINLGNYPPQLPSPHVTLFALSLSLSLCVLITQTNISLVARRERAVTKGNRANVPSVLQML